jgi:hypothetical protein
MGLDDINVDLGGMDVDIDMNFDMGGRSIITSSKKPNTYSSFRWLGWR